MTPAVSVVMPVRNAAATVGAAIESIRAQTMTDWELVIVDDGSLDDTGMFVSGLAKRDARVRLAVARYPGIVHALAAGLEAARAPLIARMDADDVALPERLARQWRHLEARPAVGLVASRVRFEGDEVAGAGYARYVEWTNRLLTHDQIRLGAFVESPFAHPSVMFRRALVERLGGYAHADGPEDYELWLRWLDAGVRMEKLPQTLLHWCDSPGRLSRVDPRYDVDAFDHVRARYLARWLAQHNPHHPDVIAWGAGGTSRRRVRALVSHGVAIRAWVDIDPRKIGGTVGSAPILAPDALPPPGACFVVSVVAAHDARDLIAARLEESGYRAGEHYVLAA